MFCFRLGIVFAVLLALSGCAETEYRVVLDPHTDQLLVPQRYPFQVNYPLQLWLQGIKPGERWLVSALGNGQPRILIRLGSYAGGSPLLLVEAASPTIQLTRLEAGKLVVVMTQLTFNDVGPVFGPTHTVTLTVP